MTSSDSFALLTSKCNANLNLALPIYKVHTGAYQIYATNSQDTGQPYKYNISSIQYVTFVSYILSYIHITMPNKIPFIQSIS